MQITTDMIAAAAQLAGLQLTDAERELMREGVEQQLESYQKLRALPIENSVPPALLFDPRAVATPRADVPAALATPAADVPPMQLPANLEELAFAPISQLAALIRTRQLSSLALTTMYLERLKRYDPLLHCVVTLTEQLALEQAQRADDELAAGRYHGPLHGIPWAVKDLFATKGIRTTWGATPFQDQMIDMDATVVRRLADAGAVLIAKLTVGELAWGDVWFGGMTRNPWNIEQGSSGSSAGSAAAVAAGLAGFTIGTETWGSIVSPSARCGATGLRPTFGRVSRAGAMALSWSMDKAGPICRTVEDCALVFAAIHGADAGDPSAVDRPFVWQPGIDITKLRVGYLRSAFVPDHEHNVQNAQALDQLRALGVEMIPIDLPNLPIDALGIILNAESAAAFDELTRSDRDELLVRQVQDAWPNAFRRARMIPAVEYIQANRVRTLAMRAMAELMASIDLYVAPSLDPTELLLTNLTGHPSVVLPHGFAENGTPTSIIFTGQLDGEANLLAFAKAYQDASGFHLPHPALSE